jgi:uncharacterized protein
MKLLTITAIALAAAAPLSSQTLQVNKENRTIAITATDSVIAMADVATLHIGFIVYGPDSDSAYATGLRVSDSIASALTNAGVPEDALESENQSVAPVQQYQVDKLTPAEKGQRKFQVTQSWTVRTNVKDAGHLLDIAVKAGANESGAIEWSLKDQNAPQAQAAAKALQRARTVATQMAAGMNVRLGPLIYASNETQGAPVQPLMRAMAAAPGPPPPQLAINPRRIEKTATVYAVFAIE